MTGGCVSELPPESLAEGVREAVISGLVFWISEEKKWLH